jgi:hypothetical protein
LGWLIAQSRPSWLVWLGIVIGVLLWIAIWTLPWWRLRNFLTILLKSDARSFSIAIAIAFVSVIMITWFHAFVQGLVLTCAVVLARLDAQTAGIEDGECFWMVAAFALAGLGLGVLVDRVI